MPWNGPEGDHCKLDDVNPKPSVRFPEDDSKNIALNGYEVIGRRPKQAIAGEQETLEEANRQDKMAVQMDKFRESFGGYGSDPGFGNDF